MEGKFIHFVVDELRTLLAEIEKGQQPSNIALQEAVYRNLRPAYDCPAAHAGDRS
jgi:hypothetical protein